MRKSHAMLVIGGLLATTVSCGRIGFDPQSLADAQLPGLNWLDSAWQYRQQITIPASAIGDPLNGFPVYLKLADLGPEFSRNVHGAGADIRITSSDGIRELPYELVGIDTVRGTGELHFKAEVLASEADNVFYIYYGNPGATVRGVDDPLGARSVWDNGFVAVYHLEERPAVDEGCGLNKACNAALAQHVGDISDSFADDAQVPGQVGGSLRFDGSNDYVDVPTLSRASFPQRAGTLSILFKLDCNVVTANESQLFDRYNPTRAHFFMRCSPVVSGKNFQMAATVGEMSYIFSKAVSVNENAWNMLTLRYDTDNALMALYQDGAISGTEHPVPGWLPTGQDFVLGATTSGSPIGQIDETRLANVVRSDAWIQAEFDNLVDTANFYQVSAQEPRPSL